ncbi:MAG: histidine--tRNA ligase [Candidatus Aenigmatarchaeota archaeon]
MKFQKPKGTRDLMPEDMAKRRKYFEAVRKVLIRYGYGEIMTPAFETLALLEAKGSIGQECVKDVFRIWDKGKEKLGYGLIFDPTTPIARIVANDTSLQKPMRWYYIRPMWRYEETRPGRYREFWQAGVELIGSDSPLADAEILAITYDCMKAMGITDFTLRVNSRKIMESLAKIAGIPEEKRTDAFRIIDKLDKIGEKEVRGELERFEIPKEAIDSFIRYVKMGKEDIKKELKDYKEALEDLEEIEQVLEYAKKMGVDNARLDLSIIRGIDYYTGFIFETFVKGYEKLGSVASGGRYDSLIEIYGGKPTPATGVGIGIDRMMEIFKEKVPYSPLVYVANAKEETKDDAIRIAQMLRKEISAEFDVLGKKLKKQFEYVNTKEIPYCVIVGPDEIKENSVVVRDMKSGKEEKIEVKKLKDFFLQLKKRK